MREVSITVLAMCMIGSASGAAHAQSGPDEQNASSDPAATAASLGGDDIVVTARRREESLQKVPIAITAISGSQLQQRQIQQETDLQLAVPGLTIRQNGSANQFNYSLRGQSVDSYSGSPPGVLPYVNDVQIVTYSATPLYDLAGVQVLKGPQGTLFGRNATGGAILFQTVRPGNEFDGFVLGRYGSYGSHYLEGALTAPFGDLGGIRVAGSYTGGGAFVRNLTSGQRLGDQDVRSARASLVLKPLFGLTNTTVVQHTAEDGDNLPTLAYSAYGCGESFRGIRLNSTGDCIYGPLSPAFQAYVAAHPNLYPGGVDAFAGLQRERGPWVAEVNVPLNHRARNTFVLNTTELEISDGITIKNIFGFNSVEAEDDFDYDGTPYPIFQTGGTPTPDARSVTDQRGFLRKTRQISNEFQLQGEAFTDRLKYVVGAFYLHQRDRTLSPLFAFDFSPIAPGSEFSYHQRSINESFAFFSQATFKATDELSVTGGLRYTWDTQTARQLPGSVFGTAAPVETLKSDKPSWTLSLDYQVTPSLLLYVAHRGSWRTGGFNYSVNPINATAADGGNRFEPETTRDVEAGIKYSGNDLGVPATFNVDFYNQWVSNVQRAAYALGVGGTATVVTANAPRAEITGVEADASVRPARWLTLGASGAYTNARYTDPNVVLFGTPTVYGPFADAPKWSGTFYADVSFDLPSNRGELSIHADLFAQSQTYFSNVAATLAPETAIGGYSLVNARIGWSHVMGSKVSAALFARNLFNRRYYAGGNSLGPTLGLNTSVPGRPRMTGGELRIEF